MKTIDIQSREDLSRFVLQLREDLVAKPGEWENVSLEDFLEAFSRYLVDIPGYYKNQNLDVNPDIPSWRVFADVLMGARIYE